MRYAVIIGNAGSNFCAYSPDVPGCVAAGDTPGETLELFREALKTHLWALKEGGGVPPVPSTLVEMIDVDEVA